MVMKLSEQKSSKLMLILGTSLDYKASLVLIQRAISMILRLLTQRMPITLCFAKQGTKVQMLFWSIRSSSPCMVAPHSREKRASSTEEGSHGVWHERNVNIVVIANNTSCCMWWMSFKDRHKKWGSGKKANQNPFSYDKPSGNPLCNKRIRIQLRSCVSTRWWRV